MLYGAEDLRLVAADAGNQTQTKKAELASLVTPPPPHEDMYPDRGPHLPTT